MNIREWDERYRSADDAAIAPVPLVTDTADRLRPGKVLDLACGAGRNALWLAEQGWGGTGVDGSGVAIDVLRRRALAHGVHVDARVGDLERGEYSIEPSAWDLVLISYYLQRVIFASANLGGRPGGVLIAIVHITETGEEPTYKRLRPGELAGYFSDW